MFSAPEPQTKECGNCGGTQGLLRCSRCHSEWFCSSRCQRAHWPFHKAVCKRNEFADMVEEGDAKFASWMRSHGKQAVLKDDEVDRIERAAAAACGTQSREEVMESMYGRLHPKPAGPSFTLEERRQMRLRHEAEAIESRRWTPEQKLWQHIEVPHGFGLDCDNYKWRQNQSHVELFVRLPPNTKSHQVAVKIAKQHLTVTADGSQLVGGELLQPVVPQRSLWQMGDGVLEVSLLKASRRGHYAPGTTNADTFWDRVWAKALPQDRLSSPHAPAAYYSSLCDDEDVLQLAAADAAAAARAQRQQQPRLLAV